MGQKELNEKLSHLENVIYLAHFQNEVSTMLLPCNLYFFELHFHQVDKKVKVFAVFKSSKMHSRFTHADMCLLGVLVSERYGLYVECLFACVSCLEMVCQACIGCCYETPGIPHCLANRA